MQYVFPFRPSPTNYSESLEWKTDISEAEDGTEVSAKVRDVPRHSLTMTAPADAKNCQLAYNMLYSGMASQWGVPLWHESFFVSGEIWGGAPIACGAASRDYVEGELALLWESSTSFQVLTISSVAGNVVYFDSYNDSANAWVMPLKVGYLQGQPQRSFNGFDEFVTVTFDIDNAQLLTPAEPDQFLGYDFEQLENTLIDGRLEGSLYTRDDVADFDLGGVSHGFTWAHSKTVSPYNFMADDVPSLRIFREWLFRRAGAYRKFWLPTFELDLRFVAKTGTYSATFYEDGLYSTETIRRQVAFRHSDDIWYARTITAIGAPVNGICEVTFAEGIATLDLSYGSWLSLRRLQSDRVEIQHYANSVARISLNTVEVEPNGDGEGILQTEPGLDFAMESGDPIAIEEATSDQQAVTGSVKISELEESTAAEASDGFLAVAIGTTNVKIPVSDLLPESNSRFSTDVGTIGQTSFSVANLLGDALALVQIVDNVTGLPVGIAPTVTASVISASGLAPIEVTNQFKVIARK